MLDDKHGLLLDERPRRSPRALHLLGATALALVALSWSPLAPFPRRPPNAPEILAKCASLHVPAGPHPDFFSRAVSDRFVPGTKATLIRNATIWTGREAGNEVVYGDVLLDGGIIKAVGTVSGVVLRDPNVNEINAGGKWLTAGMFDLHSHVGVFSMPDSRGASGDFMSSDGPVVPWMRSIDGLNTHDASYELAVAGGLTGGLILPGSGNAIGGQAFAIKFRPTAERTPSSKLIDSPLGQTVVDRNHPPRWRHMKHACGENQLRYGSRFDSAWAFRQGYEEARKIRDAQDAYCAKATSGKWDEIEKVEFPYSLKWEALVDVLRGRVKVNTHCYEAVDFDQIVRLTNEFKFPIAAFHHASEAYLVTDLLKKTWGGTPAVAIFATNGRYKREAYRASEFAPKILAENGVPVVMKTDHPIINSRDILFEAQKAHYYGLPTNLALASVITSPVIAAGLDHRLGYIKEGYDADVVLWDAHPLQVGATPTQVFIDGIPQISSPYTVPGVKPQTAPRTPRWDRESAAALKYEGLAPLEPRRRARAVAFVNVGAAKERVSVLNGRVVQEHELGYLRMEETIDLQGGHIVPGLISFGSRLGMEEIASEGSTSDGPIIDPLMAGVPSILGDAGAAIRAVDGLRFETRHALLAYRTGVTAAVATPIGLGIFQGVSTFFRLGEVHALAPGAVLKEAVALHLTIRRPSASLINYTNGLAIPSISTQIATLRRLLTDNVQGETGRLFTRAAKGEIPLVLTATSADVMAALLRMKRDLETKEHDIKLRMVFNNANEAHLLAKEIGEAGVGVILTPIRPFPTTWDERRIVPGPPLTKETALTILLRHNVTVGVGIREEWEAQHTRFMLKWAMEESSGLLDEGGALALATSNIAKLLGLDAAEDTDFVAYSGGSWHEQESKVVAVLSPARNVVDIFS
ncbi:composite domain of metallo-dependent hydrolase [Exidia glandulosa HHB12029]|uniref:Composite domain of metallo-dependent hydrolase n=1 Tax=Exidia glandulosa HHB12029 TaxID=1314781 RepID=A0A165AX87_EXIGL|nr:composite domain of metallo-dependent hydrolase [Exidia glandulosa HHB12029]